MTLSAAKARDLIQPGKYRDQHGLFLNIAKGGSKSWLQRITIDGKRREIGLGGYPAVSLTDARKTALSNLASVKSGKSVATKRRAQGEKAAPKTTARKTAPTFEETARQVHALNAAKWDSKTASNWIQRAERYVFPAFGSDPVNEVSRAQVIELLTPYWTTKEETARRLRLICKQTFASAQAYGLRDDNPAGPEIDAALPPMPKFRQHFEALPYEQVADALQQVDASTAFPSTKLAFRFLTLTACRSGEVRGARWDEVDLERGLWVIPGERMKARKEHRVPLSTAALNVLEKARMLPTGGDSPYIFPNDLTPHKQLSENALSYMLRRVGLPTTAHGMRSTFRTWAQEETEADFSVMELALAHAVGSAVVQSYARSDLLERRRCLMQAWADYIER